jgi:hypothetical protein
MLKTTSADVARHAAIALTQALQNPAAAIPFATIGDAQMRTPNQLAKTFATSTNHNNSNTPTSPRVPTTPAPSPRVPNTQKHSPSNPEPILHCYPLQSQQTANNISVFPKPHAANSVTDPIIGQVQEFRHLMMGPNRSTWMHSFANELGRLA